MFYSFRKNPRPPKSTLFPYTTLFRSLEVVGRRPVSRVVLAHVADPAGELGEALSGGGATLPLHPKVLGFEEDRKSTRLNSSHVAISYAVFCLKKKNVTVIGIDFHEPF